MPFDAVRVAEHLHGHLGWLAAVALVHPAVLLRGVRRRADLSITLAVTLVTLAAAVGASLYSPYRERLRQPLFASAPAIGYLFERKEHLAFGAVLLAWTGAVTYAGSRVYPSSPALSPALHKASHWAFVAAAALALATAVLGTVVASYRTF